MPISSCYNSSLSGFGKNNENKSFKGVSCSIKGGGSIGIISENLKERDLLKSGKVKEITGRIFALSEVHNVLIDVNNLYY